MKKRKKNLITGNDKNNNLLLGKIGFILSLIANIINIMILINNFLVNLGITLKFLDFGRLWYWIITLMFFSLFTSLILCGIQLFKRKHWTAVLGVILFFCFFIIFIIYNIIF